MLQQLMLLLLLFPLPMLLMLWILLLVKTPCAGLSAHNQSRDDVWEIELILFFFIDA
jgi:hypothetical protein